MSEPLNAVVAGSKGFVEALDGPLRMRLGAAPTVVQDPAGALLACAGAGALLVIEYVGSDWLGTVKNLRSLCERSQLPIVVAIPGARMGELADLQRAGVDEAVRWDARVDPVVWAVDRVLSARPRSMTPPPVAGAAISTETGFEIYEVPAPAIAAGGQPGASSALAAPAPPASPVPAPSALPAPLEVEGLLAAALAGMEPADEALLGVTERVLAQLTELERRALSEALPVDGAALRATAALRWRIAAVLEHARSAGSAPDADAARALPAEIDAALGALKALAGAAPADALRGIEAARNALVREAIQLTETIASAGATAVLPEAPASAKAPAARVLSNEREDTAPRRHVALWVALGVALSIAGAYHARKLLRPRLVPRASIANAPANTVGMAHREGKVLSAVPGKSVDPLELERFKAAEQAKGNVVKEVSPGTWLVMPAAQPAPSAPGGSP